MTTPALIIVQARMGSSRFPGKSLAEIDGKPILWYLFRQLSFCRAEVRLILATTVSPEDDPLAAYGESQGWNVFRGDEEDVLSRYFRAAQAFGAQPETVIIRVTGDDILPDPRLIDAATLLFDSFGDAIDCVFTADDDHLPYGVYLDSFRFRALGEAHLEASTPHDREHVSPFLKRHDGRFPRMLISSSQDFAPLHLSIDRKEDLELNARLLDKLKFAARSPYSVADILHAADTADPPSRGGNA